METKTADLREGYFTFSEEKMVLEKNNLRNNQAFPSWSLRSLFMWLVGFTVFSGVIAGLFSYAVVNINFQYGLELNSAEMFFSIAMPSYIMYMGLIFAFIVYQLRRKSHSLEDAWVSYDFQPQHIVIGLLLGMLLMSLQILAYKVQTGMYMPPPESAIRLDWRLALGTELLAKAFIPGLVEEILFRGIFYQTLRIRFSKVNAVVLSAIIFTLFHIEYMYMLNPLAMAYVFLFGLIAATLFERTRSLNICIAFHVAGNALERVIFYLMHIIPAQ